MQKKQFNSAFNVDINEIITEVTESSKYANADENKNREHTTTKQEQKTEQENKGIEISIPHNVNVYDVVVEVTADDAIENNKTDSQKLSAEANTGITVDDIVSQSFRVSENRQSSKSVFNIDLFDFVSAESTHEAGMQKDEQKEQKEEKQEKQIAPENREETEEQVEARENNENKESNDINKETGLLDYKGAIWRAVDYILFGQSAVKLETNDVSLMLYNTAKANLLRIAYQIRQELSKPVTTVISEPVVEETAKQVLETVDRLLTLQYPKIKPILEEQSKKLVAESNNLTMQEAKDTVYSQLVAKLALDWLLLGLTNKDINRIKNDELLKLMVQEYLECRESLFDYTTIK